MLRVSQERLSPSALYQIWHTKELDNPGRDTRRDEIFTYYKSRDKTRHFAPFRSLRQQLHLP